MKFCSHCGKEVLDSAVVCPNCGSGICDKNIIITQDDAPSTAWAVLGFFFPLVGFILYLVNLDRLPLKAKSAGKGALIGFICGIAVNILLGVALSNIMVNLISALTTYALV